MSANHNRQKIRVISHNCAKSTNATLSILETASDTADIVLIQEPWIGRDRETGDVITVSHPSFQRLLPASSPDNRKARTMAYISNTYPNLQATLRSDLSTDSDLQIIEISTPSLPSVLLCNIYNEAG